MNFPRRRLLRLAAGAVAIPALSRIVHAQSYPTRPVRVIVPFAVGGPTDIFARLITQKLSETLGRQFYVENIGGGGGNIGYAQAAKAIPDGHTILVTSNSYVINPVFFDKVPYDPYKDFDPVTVAVALTVVLTVNPSLPVKSVKELVAIIRADPGKYNFASGGTGTQSHLSGEQFRVALDLDLTHIPFKSGGDSTASVVAGHTTMTFGSPAQAVQSIQAGTLRALAVTSKARSQLLPDVPTMTEAGYPELEGDNWMGVLVPAGTPKDIVTLLHREIVKTIALPDMRERLATLGYDPVASTPEEFAVRIKSEMETWGKVIKAANIKP
jgi:tripartite-type tricarboxylate transporter receptor subunit TctC